MRQSTSWEQPGYYIDQDNGDVHLRGLARVASGTVVKGQQIATLPVGYRPPAVLAYTTIAHSGTGTHRLDITKEGLIRLTEVVSNTPYISLDGISFSTNNFGWKDLDLLSGWNTVSPPSASGWQKPQFRVTQETDNIRVDLRGLVSQDVGNIANGAVFAKTSLSPPLPLAFSTISHSGTANHRVDITSTGSMVVSAVGAQSRYVSLDGIVYWTSNVGWQTLAPVEGFQAKVGGSPWTVPAWRIDGNRVYLRGLVVKTSGDFTNGNEPLVLPLGIHPKLPLAFSSIAHKFADQHRVDIDPAGKVRVATAAASIYVSLDGIHFAFDLPG